MNFALALLCIFSMFSKKQDKTALSNFREFNVVSEIEHVALLCEKGSVDHETAERYLPILKITEGQVTLLAEVKVAHNEVVMTLPIWKGENLEEFFEDYLMGNPNADPPLFHIGETH